MQRNPDLLALILHYCVTSSTEWKVNKNAHDLHNCLPLEQMEQWSVSMLDGHVRLLGDAGYIEMRDLDLAIIKRVTWDGYNYLDSAQRRIALKNNPFLLHG